MTTYPSPECAPATITPEYCDRCGSHAYIVTEITVGTKRLPLAWCAHHYGRFTAALAAAGARLLVDSREELNARETGVHV